MSLRQQIQDDMKVAMKEKQTERLAAVRLLWSEIKKKEVDERIEVADEHVLAIVDKMLKQRRDSVAAFETAGRQDLVEKEQGEIQVLQAYMPQPLSEEALAALVAEAIATVGGGGMAAMGKVMAILKPQIAGRADVAAVSASVKAKLTA